MLVYGRIEQNAIVLGVDLWSKRFKRFEVSQVRFLLLGILPYHPQWRRQHNCSNVCNLSNSEKNPREFANRD
ncbi:hypothetical protein pipiens_001199 [Culex pipiens pipiens]|uniref:Uncharacterized protein n=1 Tax=Culex pipiens pipiens TaxID=38569 RepID=A0ABD1DH59_CULPP